MLGSVSKAHSVCVSDAQQDINMYETQPARFRFNPYNLDQNPSQSPLFVFNCSQFSLRSSVTTNTAMPDQHIQYLSSQNAPLNKTDKTQTKETSLCRLMILFVGTYFWYLSLSCNIQFISRHLYIMWTLSFKMYLSSSFVFWIFTFSFLPYFYFIFFKYLFIIPDFIYA